MSAPLILLAVAVIVVVGALLFFSPLRPLRPLFKLVFRLVYRVEVRGRENLAHVGPNTIIGVNHESVLDAALLLSLLDRSPIFVIDRPLAERLRPRFLLRFARVFMLDAARPAELRSLVRALKSGETLVAFPEGRLTVNDRLMKDYEEAALVAINAGATVVPIRIDGLDRTPFTRYDEKRVRRRWWPKVVVTVLAPKKVSLDPRLGGKARRHAAAIALYDVISEMFLTTSGTDRTVFQAVVDTGRREGFGHLAVEDQVSGALAYGRLLAGATILGRKLMPLAGKGESVGVMLPNAVGAVVAVLGLMSAGRVPAMINFTSGSSNILTGCRAARVKTIVTSRAFIEKAELGALLATLVETMAIVYLEDVRDKVTLFDKLRGLATARQPLVHRRPDEPAAILFTSGSEGVPKGVVLSHRNMLVNTAQAAARIDFSRADKLLNVLPMFHSFGLTAGVILPLTAGVPLFLYPSPLHYRAIPELVRQIGATIIFGTDTFLMGYARNAGPEDFRTLRLTVAGAEKVKDATRTVYRERFGIRILEGYGVTETAPVLAVNTPMFWRDGTVGRALPGIEVRVEPVPGIAEGGRLFVRGPNVMLGYLKPERPGEIQPPDHGWHDTGDIVAIDDAGFITIKGRAKRFAKIGGEMVSLAAVEGLAHELWPDNLSIVAAVPDARKGERMVMVTDREGADRAALLNYARARGLNELMVPAEVMVVESLPVMGSGKVDLPVVSEMVAKRVAARSGATA